MYLAKNAVLLEAFKKGEKDAFEKVYRHYAPGVTKFLQRGFTFRSNKGSFYFKGLQDTSELRSCVQEVFRRAFEDKARTSYNGINSFTNWVLAIGRNIVLNKFRNREIAISQYITESDDSNHLTFMDNEVSQEYTGILYGQSARAQDRQVESKQLRGLMGQFMEGLDEHEKAVLLCRFSEGRGQQETAEHLKSTRMKIRTIENKLRNNLRSFLKSTGYIDNFPLGTKKRQN
jgi:RNA polymerase sigma factor (sigma-70 family)